MQYQIYAANAETCVLIATKSSLIGALNLADDLKDHWHDISIRQVSNENWEEYKTVARISMLGLL